MFFCYCFFFVNFEDLVSAHSMCVCVISVATCLSVFMPYSFLFVVEEGEVFVTGRPYGDGAKRETVSIAQGLGRRRKE